MNTVLTILVSLFISTAVLTAQQTEGKFFIEGTFRYTHSDVLSTTVNPPLPTGTLDDRNPNTTRIFSISAIAGLWLTNTIAVGLETSYKNTELANYFYVLNGSKLVPYGESRGSTNGYSIAPIFRYTPSITEKVLFTVTCSIPYSISKQTMSSSTDTVVHPVRTLTTESIGLAVRPGAMWILHKNLAITGQVGNFSYVHKKIDDETSSSTNLSNKTTENELELTLTNFFSIGVLVYF